MSGRVRPTMSAEALALIEAAKAQQMWKPDSWTMLLNVSPTENLPQPLRSDPGKCPRCASLRSSKAKVCRSLAMSEHEMIILDPQGCNTLLPNDGNGIDHHRCGAEIAWTHTDISLLKAGHPRRRVIARVDIATARRHGAGWDETEADWEEDIDKYTESPDHDAGHEGPYLDSDDEGPYRPQKGGKMDMTSSTPTRAAMYWLPAWMSCLKRYLERLSSTGFDGVMFSGLDCFEGWGGGARNIQTGLTYREDAVVLLSGAATLAGKEGLWACAQEYGAITDSKQAKQVLQALVRVRKWSNGSNGRAGYESIPGGLSDPPSDTSKPSSASSDSEDKTRIICVNVLSAGISLSSSCLHTNARFDEVGEWDEHRHVDPYTLARVAAAEMKREEGVAKKIMQSAVEDAAHTAAVREQVLVVPDESIETPATSNAGADASGGVGNVVKTGKKGKKAVRRRGRTRKVGDASNANENEESNSDDDVADPALEDDEEAEEAPHQPTGPRSQDKKSSTSNSTAAATTAKSAKSADPATVQPSNQPTDRAKSPLRATSQNSETRRSISLVDTKRTSSGPSDVETTNTPSPTTILGLMRESSSTIQIPAQTQALAAELAKDIDGDDAEESGGKTSRTMADIAESPDMIPIPLQLNQKTGASALKDSNGKSSSGKKGKVAKKNPDDSEDEDMLSGMLISEKLNPENDDYDVNAMAFGVNDPVSSDSEAEIETPENKKMFPPPESGYGYANNNTYGYGRGWGATAGVSVRSSGVEIPGRTLSNSRNAAAEAEGDTWDDSFVAQPATDASQFPNPSRPQVAKAEDSTANTPSDMYSPASEYSYTASASTASAASRASRSTIREKSLGRGESDDTQATGEVDAQERARSKIRNKSVSRGVSTSRARSGARNPSSTRKSDGANGDNSSESSQNKATEKGEPFTKVLIDSGIIDAPTLCDLYPIGDSAPIAVFNLLFEIIQRKNDEEIENAFRYRSFAHNFLLLSALLQSDATGNRLSHLACAHGNFPALQAIFTFLRAHTQPRKRPPKTHAHYPTYNHYASCAIGVLGVVLNGGNGGGLAPLSVACACGDNDMVSLLLNMGADIRHVDNSGLAAIHVAARLQRPECMQSLITAGADVNKVARGSLLTPLMCAARSKSLAVVSLLLRHGAQAQFRDLNDHTALAHAVKAKSVHVVLTLLQADPATRVRNSAFYVYLYGGGIRDSDCDVGVHGWDICCDITVDDDEGAIDLYSTYSSLLSAYELAVPQNNSDFSSELSPSPGPVTMIELATSLANSMPHVARRHDQGVLTLAGVLMRAMSVCCFRARDGIYTYTYAQKHITPTNTLTACSLVVRGDSQIKLPAPPKNISGHTGFLPLVDVTAGKVNNVSADDDGIVGGMFDWSMRAVGRHHRWVWHQYQDLLQASSSAADDAAVYNVSVGPNVMGLGGVVNDMFARDDKRSRCACDFGAFMNPAGSLVYSNPAPSGNASSKDNETKSSQQNGILKAKHVHLIGKKRIVAPVSDEEDEAEHVQMHQDSDREALSSRSFDRHNDLTAGATAVRVGEEGAATEEVQEGGACTIM